MGSLTSKPKAPAPPPPPVVMPTQDDESLAAAKKKQAMAVQARSGRDSTILSDNGDTLG